MGESLEDVVISEFGSEFGSNVADISNIDGA